MVAGFSELWKVEAQLWRREDDLQSGCRLEKLPFPRSRDFMSRGQGSDRSVDAAAGDGKSFGQLLVFSVMGWERTDIVVGGDRKLKGHGLEESRHGGNDTKRCLAQLSFHLRVFDSCEDHSAEFDFSFYSNVLWFGGKHYKYPYYLLLTFFFFIFWWIGYHTGEPQRDWAICLKLCCLEDLGPFTDFGN